MLKSPGIFIFLAITSPFVMCSASSTSIIMVIYNSTYHICFSKQPARITGHMVAAAVWAQLKRLDSRTHRSKRSFLSSLHYLKIKNCDYALCIYIKKSFQLSKIYKKLCSDFVPTHHNWKFNRVSNLPCWKILLSFVIVSSHLPEVPLLTKRPLHPSSF
jgi:hypothetical protein